MLSFLTTDTGILLILALATMVLIGVVGKVRGWRSTAIHAVVFMCYSAPLWYALFFRGQYGASLVWLFYLLMAYTVHIVVLLTTFVIACKTRRNRLLLVMLTVVMIVLFLLFCVLFTG